MGGDEANVGAKGSGVAKEVVVTLAGGFGIVVAKTNAGAIFIIGKADRGITPIRGLYIQIIYCVVVFCAAATTCGYMLLGQSLEWLCPLSCCCYDMRLHAAWAEPGMAVPAFMLLLRHAATCCLGRAWNGCACFHAAVEHQ